MITADSLSGFIQSETSENLSNSSLSCLYTKGLDVYQKTTQDTTSAEEVQTWVSQGILHFQECGRRIRQLSLFSVNESLEEISTTHLKYMLVDAYLGELILLLQGQGTQEHREQNRRKIILSAEAHLKAFLSLMITYDTLPERTRKIYKSSLDSFLHPTEDSDLKPITAPKLRPDQIRDQKIAAYKLEKETKATLNEFRERLVSKKTRFGPHVSASEPREQAIDDEDEEDDDLSRQITLTTMNLMAQKAIQSIQVIHEELEILEFAEKRKQQQGQPTASDDASARLDNGKPRLHQYSGPLLSKDGRPMRPFVITSKREDLAKGVFRYGHNLPTMTIDEYLDREIERGNFLSGGTEPPQKKEVDDNDEEALDAETMKQREWDDFKDDNPRGWGNRYRKG